MDGLHHLGLMLLLIAIWLDCRLQLQDHARRLNQTLIEAAKIVCDGQRRNEAAREARDAFRQGVRDGKALRAQDNWWRR